MKLPPPYVTTQKVSKAYWFRRRVPDQLISIVGRGEFMETLRTRDVTEDIVADDLVSGDSRRLTRQFNSKRIEVKKRHRFNC